MLAPLELPSVTESVPKARAYVRRALAAADSAADVDTAALLVSELVTNAILHARTPLLVSVDSRGGEAHIEVHDESSTAPRLHPFSATSATGRGLRLLDSLAKRWGVEVDPDGNGKTVWCEVGPPAEATWVAGADDELARELRDL